MDLQDAVSEWVNEFESVSHEASLTYKFTDEDHGGDIYQHLPEVDLQKAVG